MVDEQEDCAGPPHGQYSSNGLSAAWADECNNHWLCLRYWQERGRQPS